MTESNAGIDYNIGRQTLRLRPKVAAILQVIPMAGKTKRVWERRPEVRNFFTMVKAGTCYRWCMQDLYEIIVAGAVA